VPNRPPVAIAGALCACGLALSAASAAPSGPHRAPPPPKVSVEGIVIDWDAEGAGLRLEETEFSGAPRRLRRALRRVDALEVVLVAGTRILAESTDGTRERIAADDLMAELDTTGEDVDVEARGRLVPGTLKPGRVPELVATRLLVYLPDPGLVDDDPLDPDDETLPDDEEPLPEQ